MSGYSGRVGPNVSQFIADLNTIDPQQTPLDDYKDDDFDMFLNTDFLESNPLGGLTPPMQMPDFDVPADAQPTAQGKTELTTTATATTTATTTGDEHKMDFIGLPGNSSGDYQFSDHSIWPNMTDPSMSTLPSSQANTFAIPQTFTSPVSSSLSPTAQGFDHANDESARVAAEEDKRRRNTAASARFRIKKKQREQQLEKTAKEMTERVNVLESRIQQLETENNWLKSLITEKNGGKASNSEIAAMVLKKSEESAIDRRPGAHVEGVGTKSNSQKA